MRLLRRLQQSRRAASAVEFALALPMLMLMLLPAMDYALAFNAEARLTAAASRAAELATGTGRVLPDYSFLVAEAQSAAPGASVQVANWLECAGVRQSNPTGLCGTGVRYARYVQVRVSDTYDPMFSLGGFIGAPVTISGEATVRIQ